ncbi:hypothetical protein D8S78_05905 [Natrialba swarupiae]|nr:hypothetical protein [Natrialba swarupiae]
MQSTRQANATVERHAVVVSFSIGVPSIRDRLPQYYRAGSSKSGTSRRTVPDTDCCDFRCNCAAFYGHTGEPVHQFV